MARVNEIVPNPGRRGFVRFCFGLPVIAMFGSVGLTGCGASEAVEAQATSVEYQGPF